MKYEGSDRRKGHRDRRSRWLLWLFVAGLTATTGATSWAGGRTTAPESESIVVPDRSQDFQNIRGQLATLIEREPEIRTVVTTRIVRDTLLVPVHIPVAVPPEIIRITDTLRVLVFRVDTLWMPPQIVTIPVHTFWSSETYSPSIGNTVWSVGGGILGYILRGVFESSARACVVINAEESCNF